VAADPQYSSSQFSGNRGVNFEYWTSTSSSDLDSIRSMTSSDANYNADWLDETYHFDNTMDDYVSKMTTFFTPPHSGSYMFLLYADDGARLFVDGVRCVFNKMWFLLTVCRISTLLLKRRSLLNFFY